METYIVDSFTDQPFKGNPAGVCLLTRALEANKMQLIARELGFSETSFIRKASQSNTYTIRFFSPKMEIPLCGHATLASAKILFDEHPEMKEITFINIQDLALKVRKDNDYILMEFPAYTTEPQSVPQKLIDALGIEEILNSEFNRETKILLLEIEDCELLEKLSPNFEQLKSSHNTINGVLVTARSKRKGYDFESRYFWPWSGTNEDPVTGGTHTFLAPYWSARLKKKKMTSFQCSERTGFMEVELIGTDKVILKSKAQIIFKGRLKI